VFLRPDSDVAADVRELLDDLLPVDPASDGDRPQRRGGGYRQPAGARGPGLIPVALRLIWDVDGVIEVGNRLGERAGRNPARQDAVGRGAGWSAGGRHPAGAQRRIPRSASGAKG